MALVERLMHDPFEPDNAKHIAVHQFFAACTEIVRGAITVAQVKNYLQMSVDDAAEFDAIIALAPGTAAGQALFAEMIHGVFILAETRAPGYDTPANVRTKIGI